MMRFIIIELALLFLLAGCSAARPPAPAPRPPRPAVFLPLPQISRSSTARAIAPGRFDYIAVAAFDETFTCDSCDAGGELREGPHSNEILVASRPASLEWLFPLLTIIDGDHVVLGLEDVLGFRIYFSRSPGAKTNFITLGKVLSSSWPVP